MGRGDAREERIGFVIFVRSLDMWTKNVLRYMHGYPVTNVQWESSNVNISNDVLNTAHILELTNS